MQLNLLQEINDLFTKSSIEGEFKKEAELEKKLNQVFIELNNSYSQYRKYIADLVVICENNEKMSIPFLVYLFKKAYHKNILNKDFKTIPTTINKESSEDEALKYLEKISSQLSDMDKNTCSLSGINFDLSNITENEAKDFILSLFYQLELQSGKHYIGLEKINEIHLNFVFAIQACDKFGGLRLFFLKLATFISRISTSNFNQLARDLSAESLKASFKYNLSEYGFHTLFRTYARQKNVISALIYGNLFLRTLENESSIDDELTKDFIWQSLILFRNYNNNKLFSDIEDEIYNNIPSGLVYDNYQLRALKLTYFQGQLNKGKREIVFEANRYLDGHREELLKSGKGDCLPWISFLYNCKSQLPKAFQHSNLAFYINIFERVVPKESIDRIKTIALGNSEKLKEVFIDSLSRILTTRHKQDFTHDVDNLIVMSNRLIEQSFSSQDKEAFLLAMLIKSDYSFVFESEKDIPENINLSQPDNKTFKKAELLKREISTIKDHISNYQNILWLGSNNIDVYQMTIDTESEIDKLANWDLESQFQWLNNNFSNLGSDSVISSGSLESIFYEDFADECKKIKKEIGFARINEPHSSETFLIKDMKLSAFPHNLLLNKKNEFLSLKKPLTNIISRKWFRKKNQEFEHSDYLSKGILIPTKQNDLVFHKLKDSLEEDLKKYDFNIIEDIESIQSLNDDLNILASHGRHDISSIPALFTGSSKVIDAKAGLNQGTILVLLVCHSGSMKENSFNNKVTSLVRHFLEGEYEAVIAPFWSLHIDIVKLWLPQFIKSLESGEKISVAHFKAIKKVKDKYPSPSAWACLHLYGNANFRVSKNR